MLEEKKCRKLYGEDTKDFKIGWIKRSHNLIRKGHRKPKVVSPYIAIKPGS